MIARKNILISGGTGSGKTTLLNCLSDFIPDKERIITVEDTAELQLKKEHVVRLEAKESNVKGAGAYAIRDLVKNAVRMRPDRIVVGECRGPGTLDMLQAMNTGHDGSLTTIHANSAEDVVLRLEVLVQMAAELPVDSIHRQISSAIDLVVQLNRAQRRPPGGSGRRDRRHRSGHRRRADERPVPAGGRRRRGFDADRGLAFVHGGADRKLVGAARHLLPIARRKIAMFSEFDKPALALAAVSSLAAFGAAYLGALWFGAAWDEVSKRYVTDLLGHMRP